MKRSSNEGFLIERVGCVAASDLVYVHMQLVIGGRNKYLINGHVAQPT